LTTDTLCRADHGHAEALPFSRIIMAWAIVRYSLAPSRSFAAREGASVAA
jgi:hypothetical protein